MAPKAALLRLTSRRTTHGGDRNDRRRGERAAVTDTLELADRYVSIWIQEDAERRRRAVSALWTEDAVHILQLPAARAALNGKAWAA